MIILKTKLPSDINNIIFIKKDIIMSLSLRKYNNNVTLIKKDINNVTFIKKNIIISFSLRKV